MKKSKTPAEPSPKPEDFPDPGNSNQLASNPVTEEALDALFQEQTTSTQEAAAVDDKAPAPVTETTDAEVKPEEAVKEPVKTEEKTQEPEKEATKAEEKVTEDKKVEPTAEDSSKKKPDTSFVDDLLKKDAVKTENKPADPFDNVKLRSDASQKTKDTFEELKKLSREAVEAERKRVAEYELKLKEAEERAQKANELPEDVKKELEELRGFRATFDIERDPQFQQKFDARKQANYDSVYQTLTRYGLPEAELAKLKDLPELERVEAVSDLISKLPAYDKVRIEAKLVENASIDDERAKELEVARSKADQILRERASEAPRKQEEFYQQVSQHAKQLAEQVDIFSRVDIPSDAPPAEKARLEASNKSAEGLQGLYVKLLADETPAGKAQAALGTVLAHAYAAEVKTLREQNEKLANELAAIKKASGVGSKGVPSSAPRASRPTPLSSLDAGQSLDRLYAETMGS